MSWRKIAVAFALSLPAVAEAQEWTRFARPAEGFRAEFSGRVIERPMELGAGIKPHVLWARTYMQEGRDFVFAISVQRYRRAIDLDRLIDASFATLQCKDTEDPSPLPVPGAAARELKGQKCLGGDFAAVLRHYRRALTVYQVMSIHRPAAADDAQHFLDSFELTEERPDERPRAPQRPQRPKG